MMGRWDSSISIPKIILCELIQHRLVQDLDLRYALPSDEGTYDLPPELAGCEKLTALALGIRWNVQRRWNIQRKDNLKHCRELILGAPALKSLTLAFVQELSRPGRSPAVGPGIPWKAGDIFPPLETFILDGCYIAMAGDPLLEHVLHSSTLRNLTIRQAPLESMSQLMGRIRDQQPGIHLLHLCIETIQHIADGESLHRWEAALNSMLQSSTGLQQLILRGVYATPSAIAYVIENHTTLRTLELTGPFVLEQHQAQEVKRLAQSCPKLQKLALCLARDQDGFVKPPFLSPVYLYLLVLIPPQVPEIANSLRHFSQLRHLTISTPLFAPQSKCYQRTVLEPQVTGPFVRRVTSSLRPPLLEHLILSTIILQSEQPLSTGVFEFTERYRHEWHLAYTPGREEPDSARDVAQEEEEKRLIMLCKAVGWTYAPPEDWVEYQNWRHELEDAVTRYRYLNYMQHAAGRPGSAA